MLKRIWTTASILFGFAVEKLAGMVSATVEGLFALKRWVVGSVTEDAPTTLWQDVKKRWRLFAFQELLLFIGGFICIFCFEEAKGDLTWFRRMLNYTLDLGTKAIRDGAHMLKRKLLFGVKKIRLPEFLGG